jgi:hypothetical protein
MRRDDGGSASLLVIVMLPLLLSAVAGVVQLGALRVLAGRIASAADLATLAAVDDQDQDALLLNGSLRLASDASGVARQFFALNLAQIAPHLAVSPEAAAAAADVIAFPNAPSTDPLTGTRYERPAVRLSASVPVRTPAFAVMFLPAVTVVNVRAASTAR